MSKIKKWKNNLSIKSKFIFLTIFIISILSICLSILSIHSLGNYGEQSQQITSKALEQQAEEYLYQITYDNARKNDLFLQNIMDVGIHLANMTTQIFQLQDIYVPGYYWKAEENLYQGKNGYYHNSPNEKSSIFIANSTNLTNEILTQLEQSAYMDYYVKNIVDTKKNIVAIYLGTKDEITRYYPNIQLGTLVPADFKITSRPWYKAAIENNTNNTLVWSEVYNDAAGYGLMITASIPIFQSTIDLIGALGLDVTINTIVTSLNETTFLGNGYFFLFDENNNIIFLPEKGYIDIFGREKENEEISTNLNESRIEIKNYLQQNELIGPGPYSIDMNGSSYYITSTKINSTGWTLASIAYKENILSSIAKLEKNTDESISQFIFVYLIPSSIILLILFTIVGIIFTSYLTDPIEKLSDVAENVAKGNYNLSVPKSSTNDEVSKLNNSFSYMIDEIKKSRHELNKYNLELERLVQDRTHELDKRVVELKASEEANLNILEDLNYTIKNLTQAKEDIKKKNIELEKTQHELKILNKYLEEKVQQRTEKIQQLLKQKDEFIHLLAHDLKNPLTTPLTLLPILKTKIEDEKLQEILNASIRGINNIKRLINETLKLARLDDTNKTLDLKQLKLNEKITDVIEINRGLFEKNNFKIENHVDTEIDVIADEFQLEEVLNNIFSNAIKYTPENIEGKIIIDVDKDEDFVKISITDNGSGLTIDDQTRIFEKFYKSGHPREGMDSTGLGLGICKSIVEKHGGSIWAESTGIGNGSTFYFTLKKYKNE